MTSNVKKNFFWNTFGSLVNSCTSLFFLIAVTRINGVDTAGIFTFAFSTACLLQVIGTYAGRSYQVTNTDKNISDSDFIFNKYFSCLLMFLCCLGFILIRGYELYKCIIIVILVVYKMIEAYSETIYAIIQRKNELYKVGISLFLKGLLGLLIFILIDLITKNIIISSISLIVTNIIVLLLYDLRNIKDYQKTKFDYSKIKKVFIYGFFVFVFTFLTQYIINAPKYAIDDLMTNEYQTVFGIILMPATVMILCSQFLVQPFLVSLTNKIKEKKYIQFSNMTIKIVLYVLIFGIIAQIIAYFIGIPFLELIYGINLKEYLTSLLIIIVGATFFGMSYVISTALVTLRKTFIQALMYGIASIFVLFVSKYLVLNYSILGASLSYLLTMLLLLIQYIVVFIIIIRKKVHHE